MAQPNLKRAAKLDIRAVDNIFGLFLLPIFGVLSDRCASKQAMKCPLLMALSVAGAKYGDAILIDEVARREKAVA